MAFTDTARNTAAAAITAEAAYVSFHTADPGDTGANEVVGGTYARQLTTWGAAADGDVTGSEVTADIPAGTTLTHWGLWSAATGGVFYGGWALAVPESYGGAGTFAFTPTVTADNPA